MKKYFLIVIALSVLQEIEFQLRGTLNRDERDVRNRIRDYAEAAGIDYDFHLSVREVSMPDDRCALYYRNGFADSFDDREDSGECLDFLLLGEDGTVIAD